MKNLIIITLVATSILGCNFSRSFKNKEADKKEAEKVTKQFFQDLKDGDFAYATELFGDKFYAATSKVELLKILETNEKKLGTFQSSELTQWNTMVIEGSTSKSTYNLLYSCEFENDSARIAVFLYKNDKDSVKIQGFNIESDAYLKD
ncbi:MAG: hypothetical protein COA58_04725 [Bacteroidetes bacterium]|nr:MAG: hypothetical protein COA58_04725 [Bacteroidota bacterium]